METVIQRPWINVAVAGAFLVFGAGVAVALGLSHVRGDLGAVITAQGNGRQVFVGVGSVTNSAGVGGDALTAAAHDAMNAALTGHPGVTTEAPATATQRGARVSGPRGHVFDANIQSVRLSAESVQASVSIVVSSSPTRAYEFESTSSITMSGPSAATPEGEIDCVRRAMTRATQRAVDQILQ